jgi:predicted  nucleic acid-binding Zn-ribbon protein
MSPNIEIIDDLKYVKDATKIAWSCLRSAEIVERYFKLMHQGALTLRETINKEYVFWSSSFEETNSLYVSLIDLYESEVSSLKIEINLLQMINATYNDALVDEIKHLSADVRSKENELQQIKDEQIGLYHQSEDFKPRIIEVLNYSQWNTNFCNELFNGSMKTMQTYVDTIEGLFKEFQEQKKTKTPDTTYEKRVYEFNKRAVQERLANAEEKLRLMIEGRSKVYVKLYEFLRKCIPVREHLVDFNKSLEHCSAKIRQNMTRMKQWMPSHHQRMQDIMGKLNTMGMGSKRMGGAATPSAIDPSMIGNLMRFVSSQTIITYCLHYRLLLCCLVSLAVYKLT